MSTTQIESPLQPRTCLNSLQSLLLQQRTPPGHWVGQLAESALSTATAVSALSFYLDANPSGSDLERIRESRSAGINWLLENQNSDGGWGDTVLNYSNISTSMLVLASLSACRRTDEYSNAVTRLQTYIDSAGGVEAIKNRYGKDKTFAVPILANCAMAGIVDWKHVDAFPFEAACIPQRFFRWMQLPVVSYAIPALVAIGQVKFQLDPPRNPLMRWIRSAAQTRSLAALERMQPESGGYLEAIPLTSFVCMALIKCGRANHPVVQNGIKFLLDSFREFDSKQGAWPIDTNLATWVTTLSVNALAADTDYEFDNENWQHVRQWILKCQYKTVHPFTGAEPGGWGWSDLSGAVPDADDTPGALLALHHLDSRMPTSKQNSIEIHNAAVSGVRWLLNLQNRDRGWPTFCRGWGKFPFDRSGNDLTAHAIRALLVWHDRLDGNLSRRCGKAIKTGFRFLSDNQHNDGYWLPLWFGNQDQVDEINPFYGTAKVLMAYFEAGRLDTQEAQLGLEWIRDNQNADGGWGGGSSVTERCSALVSSVEETALCSEVLLLDDQPQSHDAAKSGLQWLSDAIDSGDVQAVSPIGFYFAKLWYFCLLYTSPSPRDRQKSRMPSSA